MCKKEGIAEQEISLDWFHRFGILMRINNLHLNEGTVTKVFKLEIVSGNDAMQTVGDLYKALVEVTEAVDSVGEATELENFQDMEVKIRDVNGNVVGRWSMAEEK